MNEDNIEEEEIADNYFYEEYEPTEADIDDKRTHAEFDRQAELRGEQK